jgi:uncharacterized surface protein with fasciclin (FAS1) repeats
MNSLPKTLLAAAFVSLAAPVALAGDCGSSKSAAMAVAHSKDIVDTASSAGSFNTLVAAVKAAGLVDALKGDGPLTVFAPTDEAFAKLPKGTVENLLKPENKDQLTAILTYHVVSGRVMAADAAKGATVRTLQGATVTSASKGGSVQINNARVLTADLETSNGVIHVIDTVLMPPVDRASLGRN